MSVKAFRDMFEIDLNEKVIKRSVNKSSEVAQEFLQ